MTVFYKKVIFLTKMLFTFNGRLNRLNLVVLHIFSFVFMIVIGLPFLYLFQYNQTLTDQFYLLAKTIGVVISFGLIRRRLQDLDRPLSWAIALTFLTTLTMDVQIADLDFYYANPPLYFLAVISTILSFALIFPRGTVGPNKYGEDPLEVDPLQFLRDVHKKQSND